MKVGIVSGLYPHMAKVLKTKLLAVAQANGQQVDVIENQDELRADAPTKRLGLGDRKITVLNAAFDLDKEGADVALIADLRVQPYLKEVQTEIQLPLVDLYATIGEALIEKGVKHVGLLGGALTKEAFLLATGLKDVEVEVLSEEEIKDFLGVADAQSCAAQIGEDFQVAIKKAADALMGRGAQLLIPNCTRIAGEVELVQALDIPLLDILSLYAKKVLAKAPVRLNKPFKVGMIGGLGPAATVDLYDKIVRATPAKNDQEHFKVVVEQNPQIPDRTACLLRDEADPTLAMYGCARRLEADGCDAIIVPCNTAHAFIPYLERHLNIPFINMQQATMDEIYAKFGKEARIGLMATTGTVQTGIYSEKAKAMGMPLFVPDEAHQERVMQAIYGPKGAKAGFTDGLCHDDLVSAAQYLVKTYDCNCLILGCTELPLILQETDDYPLVGKHVALIDPTAVLARKVVKVAQETNLERGTR